MDKKWRAKVEAERMIKLMDQIAERDDPEFKNSVTMSCARRLLSDIGRREFDEYVFIFEPNEVRVKD